MLSMPTDDFCVGSVSVLANVDGNALNEGNRNFFALGCSQRQAGHAD